MCTYAMQAAGLAGCELTWQCLQVILVTAVDFCNALLVSCSVGGQLRSCHPAAPQFCR
jgi:hypothetical protein